MHASAKKSTRTNHQSFILIREFLKTYINFPNPVYADICALWALGTHVFDRFDTFGYMVITASVRRAGKTTLAELVSFVSASPAFGTSMTASIMRRLIAKGSTMFFDEAESLNSEAASAQREYLNAGNRRGGMVYMPGAGPDEVIEYPAFGPKCFILIGDVNDTLRDRSIPIELQRARAPKPYRRSEAESVAKDMIAPVVTAAHLNAALDTETIDFDVYDYLEGREAEIWTVILTMAHTFAPESFDEILKLAVDLNALKSTTEKRTFREIRVEAENAAQDETYHDIAIADLATIFKHGEKSIHADEAIERMKLIVTSPWRTYKGTGLTAVLLSNLLAAVNTKTKKGQKQVKIGGVNKRGFYRSDVEEWAKKLGKE